MKKGDKVHIKRVLSDIKARRERDMYGKWILPERIPMRGIVEFIGKRQATVLCLSKKGAPLYRESFDFESLEEER